MQRPLKIGNTSSAKLTVSAAAQASSAGGSSTRAAAVVQATAPAAVNSLVFFIMALSALLVGKSGQFFSFASASFSSGSSGSLCGMPLWQSMQVRLAVFGSNMICDASFCLWGSIAFFEWQLRHSSESRAFIESRTLLASAQRCASNFSGVFSVPTILWKISLVAALLRPNFAHHSGGTWQSGHVARTPEQFLK